MQQPANNLSQQSALTDLQVDPVTGIANNLADNLESIAQNFHFLRPEWLYAIIPAFLLFLLLRQRQRSASSWERAINPALLLHLLDNTGGKIRRSPFSFLLVAWILSILALAGPVWIKTAQPILEREDALIVILDLTRSMYANDVKPNRLIRAKRKLEDLLRQRDEGVTGLIVFAGDAHTVTPLTDDTNTIIAMIPSLSPKIMPAPGSRLAPGLLRAVQLFKDAGVSSGRILIITDEIRDLDDAQDIAAEFRYSYPVSVLSVGTPEGAPVPLSSGSPNNGASNRGYLKDAAGNLVIPQVNYGELQSFARQTGGRFSSMTLSDEDLAYLLAEEPLLGNETLREIERNFDIWFEEGPWLILLLLPLAALSFRRGWAWCFALLFVLPSQQADAGLWDDLWQTRDQQAMNALKDNDSAEAAQLFENQDWKGAAHYKSDNFKDAGRTYAGIKSGEALYNLGNSLARQGKLEEAIEAFDDAIVKNPDSEDALFNKQLVEALLQQQEQQQQEQQQQQSDDGENGDSDDGEDQQKSEQSQDEDGEDGEQSMSDQQQEGSEEEENEQAADEDEQQPEGEQQMAEEDAKLDAEEQQALQQWLRRVPDDPGGLLRRKFEQQYEESLRNGSAARSQENPDW